MTADRQTEQRLKMGLPRNDTQVIVELYVDFYFGADSLFKENQNPSFRDLRQD